MSAQIGINACVVVELAVKTSLNPNAIWTKKATEEAQSTVGCIQLYLDKSQASISIGPYTFYSLHIMLLKFTDSTRRKTIASVSLIVAYIPVRYSDKK